MLGQRDIFRRGAEGAAIALSVVEPDTLTDAKPRDAVTELIDSAGAIAVGYHAFEFHRAIAAGAAADTGGMDAGGFEPDPDFAGSSHWRWHVAKAQHIDGRTRSLIPDGLHSERLHSERAWKCARVEQDVLSGDKACLCPAQKRTGLPEFLGVAEASGGIEFCALGQHLVDGNATPFRFRLRDRTAPAVGVEGARQ